MRTIVEQIIGAKNHWCKAEAMTIQLALQRFRLQIFISADIRAAIDTWEATNDGRVLKHELLTGQSLRGRPLDDRWLYIARMAAEQGTRIPPYYGTIQDAYSYTLSFSSNHLVFRCRNSETDDELVLHSPWPPRGESQDGTSILFEIVGRAYRTLARWSIWNRDEAFSGRYTYLFVPTTIGCFISVTDTITGEECDLTLG